MPPFTEAAIRDWANRCGVELGRTLGEGEFIAIARVPKIIHWHTETQDMAVWFLNNVPEPIARVQFDDREKGSNGGYCVTPIKFPRLSI